MAKTERDKIIDSYRRRSREEKAERAPKDVWEKKHEPVDKNVAQ